MKQCVLLVEDDPTDEKLTLQALRKTGRAIDVHVARDGAEAMDVLFGTGAHAGRALGSDVILVLLDLKLPRIDGLEVLRRIRADETTRNVPVVVLTASAEREDVARSYAGGANAYVRKPIEFSEFVEAAQSLVRFWLVLNQAPPPTHGRP